MCSTIRQKKETVFIDRDTMHCVFTINALRLYY